MWGSAHRVVVAAWCNDSVQTAIEMARLGGRLVSHRFPLKRAVEAFRLNAGYANKAVKVMIES